MGDLRAEKRADKNGKVSTKWVRDSDAKGKASALPAPSAPAPMTDEMINVLSSMVSSTFMGSRLHEEANYKITDFDPKAVLTVDSILRNAPREYMRNVDGSIMNAFRTMYLNLTDSPNISQEELFLPFNNLAAFGSVTLNDDAQGKDVSPFVRGLKKQFGSKRDFLHEATDDEREAATALLTVATRIGDEYLKEKAGKNFAMTSKRIASSELADFVMENRNQAEAIASIVNERGTDDPKVIAEIMHHQQQALRSGVL